MISIGLNLILGLLLFCALILGVRLERRLRGLRQGHADFAKAVGELDQAAARTEASLQALRAGTEAAKSDLASRIDQARIACQRLEKLSTDAEQIISRPLPLSQPAAAAPSALAPSALARPEPEALRPAAPVQVRPAPAPAPQPSRSRAKLIDDDLFATGAPPPPRRPEPFMAEPFMAESVLPEPVRAEPASALREPVALYADNDPLVGAPNAARAANDRAANDRAAREAFYREVLDRESFTPDPFESGRFAHERRVMLAAVMGGRR